jgi:hypothetical protein
VAGETEIDYFVDALDELLGDAERNSAWLRQFGVTMARGALKRTRSPATSVRAPL